jgi:hypothetical protein
MTLVQTAREKGWPQSPDLWIKVHAPKVQSLSKTDLLQVSVQHYLLVLCFHPFSFISSSFFYLFLILFIHLFILQHWGFIQGPALARQLLYYLSTWARPPVFYFWVYFSDSLTVSLLGWPQTSIHLSPPPKWFTVMYHHAQLLPHFRGNISTHLVLE